MCPDTTYSTHANTRALPCWCRFNVRYAAGGEYESLDIYFAKANRSGVRIVNTNHIAPGLLADFTASEQLVSLELEGAAQDTVCHFYDTDQCVGHKQPLAITWDYDPASGDLFVYLTGGKAVGHLRHTEDPRVLIGTTDEGLWQAFVVRDAAQSIPAGASQAA